MAKVDGQTVKVGDCVGFKSDIEQYGTIIKINGDMLTLECKEGFEGGYIGGQTITQERVDYCWID
jgi:hypothetical protein